MPKTRGYAAMSASAPLTPWEFDRREIGENDISIEIEFAGICHSDIHQAREEWGKAKFPMVPGHEIVGRVSEVGNKVSNFKIGDLAGVGCYVDSCGKCEYCIIGESHWCLESPIWTYNGTEYDGQTPTYGGYSRSIVVNANHALHVPENLDRAGVAPLLCAGITTYSPLRHWGAGPGKKVAVMGLGGLGHMAVKLAVAMGAEVTVLSHSDNKCEDALAMGAKHFVNSSNRSALREQNNTFDLIINTVSADIDLSAYLETLRMHGSLVVVGIPEKPYEISPNNLLGRQRSLAGSSIGSIKETQEMLDFCGTHNITSDVEVINADYINQAYDRVVSSDVKYRFVIDATTF